jgi:hypothetical protein
MKNGLYGKCISEIIAKIATKYRNYANQTTKYGKTVKKRGNKGKINVDLREK